MVEQQKSTTNKSKDALSTCDSSSEVSDEGYKSSQGNVNNAGTSPNGIRSSTDLSSNKSCANSSETSSHEGIKLNYTTYCVWCEKNCTCLVQLLSSLILKKNLIWNYKGPRKALEKEKHENFVI